MTQVMDANNNSQSALAADDIQGPAWAQSLRSTARERFAEIGYPTRRDEEWRYTNVAPIVETPFKLSDGPAGVTPAQLEPYVLTGVEGIQLVFVNGAFVPHLSTLLALPAGAQVGSLTDAIAADDPIVRANLGCVTSTDQPAFVALNSSVLADGAFIHVPRGVVIEHPIHLLYVSAAPLTPNNGGDATDGEAPIVSHPRNLIVAGENSQATIVESYVGLPSGGGAGGGNNNLPSGGGAGGGVYFTNVVTEFICAPSAVIDHYKVQRESAAAYHIATMQIQLSKACNFTSHSISFGGSLVRNDINAVLAAEGIECTLNGLYTARDRQVVDNHTSIDHAMPHCNSHELYKGIIDGRGRGVFNGKIFVREDAQKTDAKQTNQTLLLSSDAQINTKPQLEIYADDVKCTHGATIGQLSDEALFYLRSRGIDKETARELLTYAFASDIVSRIKVEPIRAQLDHILLSERALEGIEA